MTSITRFSILLILVIFLPIVFAQDFDVSITPIKNKITINEEAEFDVVIKNNLNSYETFRITNPNYPQWDMRTEPRVSPITADISPNGTKTTRVYIDPLYVSNLGVYDIYITAQSERTNEIIKRQTRVSITSTAPIIGGYVPTVVIKTNIPDKIDPREKIPLKLKLDNQNLLDMPELILKIEGDLVEKEIKTSLGPKELKAVELEESIDPLTTPGKYL